MTTLGDLTEEHVGYRVVFFDVVNTRAEGFLKEVPRPSIDVPGYLVISLDAGDFNIGGVHKPDVPCYIEKTNIIPINNNNRSTT